MGRKKELYTIFHALFLLYAITTTSFQSDLIFSLTDSEESITEIMAILDVYENDNDFASAKNIALNSLQERSISSIDDVDYAKFTLDSFYLIHIETSGYSGDTRLWVFDLSYNQLNFDDDEGINQFSYISGFYRPGSYYIKIDEFGNDNEIDNYNLTLSATLMPDLNEDDNLPANVIPIELNYNYQRSIYPIGDLEHFSFTTIFVEYNVTLEITGTDGNTEMRVCTDLENEIITEIAYDDDSGTNGFSKIVLINLAPATYYIKIWAYNNASEILNYTLNTEATSDYVTDTEGPEITPIDLFITPFSSSPIIILATVIDPSGVASVQLNYKLNGADWEIIDLIYDMDSVYGICVGPLEVEDEFTYYFSAYDKTASNFLSIEDNTGSYYNFVVTSLDFFDPLEKDDSLNYTRDISLNSTTDRRIAPIGDVDYCTFSLDIGYTIVIETSGTSGDTVLFLYDENITLITVNDNSGVDSFSKIIWDLNSGNYTLKIIENGDDEVIINYSITLTAYEIYEIHEFTIQLSLTITLIVIISIVLYSKNGWKRKMKKIKG